MAGGSFLLPMSESLDQINIALWWSVESADWTAPGSKKAGPQTFKYSYFICCKPGRIHVFTAAAFTVFLHIANHFFHAHYKRIALQKPPGTAASSQRWRTSNWALGWPRPEQSNKHPLSRLDQTTWCWTGNMRMSSLGYLLFLNLMKAQIPRKASSLGETTWLSAAHYCSPPSSSGNISLCQPK